MFEEVPLGAVILLLFLPPLPDLLFRLILLPTALDRTLRRDRLSLHRSWRSFLSGLLRSLSRGLWRGLLGRFLGSRLFLRLKMT